MINQMDSKEAAWRAVHIIKFLGTDRAATEYTLVLENFLRLLPRAVPLRYH
jgi:hypothetical protein